MIRQDPSPCHVCGHIGSTLLWTTTWAEHGYPGKFAMRQCTRCGLLFNSPRITDAELIELYGRNYYFFNRPAGGELARVVAMYQRTIALVAEQVAQKRCLDIGCGRGYLPAVLRELGWDARGVEISSDAAGFARKQFALDVFTGTLEQYAASDGLRRFPLVTAIDLIEHVPAPKAFAAAAARVVEPGGLLIIDTPNAASHNIRTRGIEWAGFNPFHIHLFTIENLTMLLEAHGFGVERAFSYNNAPQQLLLRDRITRVLRRTGLIRPAAKLYFVLKGLSCAWGNLRVSPALKHAAERIRALPAWDETPDARLPLSSDRTGDNIIVIARRVSD